jgi:hypothetical protein
MAKRRKQKPSFKPSMDNPSGSVDKTAETKNIPGVSDDTRVVFAEERNQNDG